MEYEAKPIEVVDSKSASIAVISCWSSNAASVDADVTVTPDAAEYVTIIAPNVTIDALVKSIEPVQLTQFDDFKSRLEFHEYSTSGKLKLTSFHSQQSEEGRWGQCKLT